MSCYNCCVKPRNSSISPRAAATWEDRWVRFKLALKVRGVEPGHHDFYRGWVLRWLGFIKPKQFRQADETDFRAFLSLLEREGKQDWQIRQAEEALRVFYQDVQPAAWARNWPEDAIEGVTRGWGRRRVSLTSRAPAADGRSEDEEVRGSSRYGGIAGKV